MNPQYVPQQGAPPSQAFPPNRSSPSLGPPTSVQSFQNIPLGPQKPQTGPPQQPSGPFIPISSHLNQIGNPSNVAGNSFPPHNSNMRPQVPPGQLPPSQIPQNQLPPSQLPPSHGSDHRPPSRPPPGGPSLNNPPSNQIAPPTSKLEGLQNGPHQFQNGPPQFQNGAEPSFRPPSAAFIQQGQLGAPNKPPGQASPSTQPSNNFGLPGPNQLPRPGQPPMSGLPPVPSSNSSHPSQTQHPLSHQPGQIPPTNQPVYNHQPPLSGQPPLPGQPRLSAQPPLLGQPPFPNQPSLPGQPPLPNHPSLPTPGQPPFQKPGQPPFQKPGQPPFQKPGQPFPNQYPGQPPLPGVPSHQPPQHPPGPLSGPTRTQPSHFNQPPLPGPPDPNQLPNQMQNMNLGGPRQYPSGPIQNGSDNGPHMPPPLNQQQYMNGQQVRGPPGPGYPPGPGGYGSYPQPSYQQQQQPKRLDPDQMPSPIQVTQDDQANRSGVFNTNQKGLVPPLVTTNFIVQDQGNASPRFMRSTMYNVPISQDIMKQTAVPFSLAISPMARIMEEEYPPPIVNFGELGPIRCIRCKAYMCPYMQFIDSGRRFQCLFCKATTDVPAEYFQHLDHTGQRIDRYERPELVLGTYEFVATTDYCRNNVLPKPPAFIFVIDVSYNNIKSGLVHLLCSEMKEIIKNLPVDQGQEKSNMKVGFITYNSSVHFYNIKGNLAAPQMLIVGDTQEMFMPLLDGFLCTPEESEQVIDALMQQIPAMFGDTRETETILLPAILAGLEALKASECTGKLLVFHSSLPTAEAPGKLKNRDDRKLLGTEKERTVLVPQTQAYNQLGQDCVNGGCSVDLYIFNNAYIDIATIGQVSRLTGGEVHKYTYFQADIDGERLIKDIIINISRPIAFDAIMRVRTSTGVRPTDFYGHFYMSNTTDMELGSIDCDKAVAIEIKHDDKLSEDEGVYIQAALLYTSCSGQRRLRIINLSLKTCSQMADLYRSCDCDTIINYLSKQAAYKLFEHTPKAVKDNIVSRAAQILATYRKHCATPSSAGQLILPECMKLLPLYVNCLLKNDALSGGSDMTVDDRSYVMQEVMVMDVATSLNYFYPRLIPLIDLDPTQEPVEVPAPVRCTLEKMNEQGVYILENGIHMFLWIGLGVNPDFTQKVFGVPSAIQIDIEKTSLPELDNPLALAVRTIIDKIRIQRHRHMRLTIVRQREKLEPVFKHFLAEDRGTDGSPSYVDFLVHMHKEIRSLLS